MIRSGNKYLLFIISWYMFGDRDVDWSPLTFLSRPQGYSLLDPENSVSVCVQLKRTLIERIPRLIRLKRLVFAFCSHLHIGRSLLHHHLCQTPTLLTYLFLLEGSNKLSHLVLHLIHTITFILYSLFSLDLCFLL